MYVHDEGDEFYLHYDFWPKVPFIHHSQENEYFADIVVRKELEVKNEKCQDGNYNYFGKSAIGKSVLMDLLVISISHLIKEVQLPDPFVNFNNYF